MGTQYLIDTNAVIEFLGAVLPASGSNWLQGIIDQDIHCLSVINQIGLLSFNGSTSEMKTLEDFVNNSNILPLSEAVIQKTIDLRKSLKIKLPDAIIAGTALSYNLVLVTRNTSDFKSIDGLICIDAHMK